MRWLRALRGLGLTLLAFIALWSTAFLLDLWLGFTAMTFGIALAVVVAVTALTALFRWMIPFCARLEPAALAAVIERRHPELTERLSTTIGLAAAANRHGAAAFQTQVVAEAGAATRPIMARNAISPRGPRRLAAGALVAALLLGACGLTWQPAADFNRRLFTAWSPPAPFDLTVTPGTTVVASGRPLTIAVGVTRRAAADAGPLACHLLYRADGDERRIPMALDAAGFIYTIESVEKSFVYRIDAGRVASDVFTVTAIEPVELAGSPKFTITPPPYVNPQVHPPEVHPPVGRDGGELAALQYSNIHLQSAFTRPALAAHLRIHHRQTDKSWSVPLRAAAAVDVDIPALDPGTYDFVLVAGAEHGIQTVHLVATVSIWADESPVFTERPQAQWSAGELELPPNAEIPLKVGVDDKVGVGAAEVQYRVNQGPVQVERLADGQGLLRAAVDASLRLQGKVKDGDEVRYRVAAYDNRRLGAAAGRDVHGRLVPADDLKPHVIYWPAGDGGWVKVKIRETAAPLVEQQIAAHRDAAQAQIDAIRRKIEAEQKQVAAVREQQREPDTLSEQAAKLAELRRLNKEIAAELRQLAKNSPPARAAGDIAAQEMQRADDSLGQARDPKRALDQRDADLARSEEELQRAERRLEQIARNNRRWADDRLAQMRLEQLAQKQQALVQQAPATDARKMEAVQGKLAKDLRQVTQQSPLLRNALQAAQGDKAKQLAEQAGKLAEAQREINQALQAQPAAPNPDTLAALARRQQALADKIGKLARETAAAKRANPLAPLPVEPPQQAANALKDCDINKALKLQETAASDLDRLARDLAGGPHELGPSPDARQFAKLQEELTGKLEKLGEDFARLSPQEGLRRLAQITHAQEDLRDGAAKLDLRSADQAAREVQHRAVEHAALAAKQLQQRDALSAHQSMEKSQQALAQLARMRLPKEPFPAKTPDEKADQERGRQARLLADEQRRLRDEIARAVQRQRLLTRQEELRVQTGELAKGLMEVARKTDAPHAQQAQSAAEQAHQAMQEAERDRENAFQLREQAADLLQQAQREAEVLRQPMMAKSKDSELAKLGQSLERAQQQMQMSQGELAKGPSPAAQAAMREAAQTLSQAAQQAMQFAPSSATPQAATQPNPTAFTSGAGLTTDLLPKDMHHYAGKTWGELPGELRARLLQDLRARYGDQYATVIQRYFESIAQPR